MCFLLKLCEEMRGALLVCFIASPVEGSAEGVKKRLRAGNCPRGGAKKFFSGKPLQIVPICAILLLSRKLNSDK